MFELECRLLVVPKMNIYGKKDSLKNGVMEVLMVQRNFQLANEANSLLIANPPRVADEEYRFIDFSFVSFGSDRRLDTRYERTNRARCDRQAIVPSPGVFDRRG
jgi:hypothetical protein